MYSLTSTDVIDRDVKITEFRTLFLITVTIASAYLPNASRSCLQPLRSKTFEELQQLTFVPLRLFVPVVSSLKSGDALCRHYVCLLRDISDQLNAV